MSRGLFDLTGKVALVTGGSSGLGLGFATGLAKQGADVVIWARTASRNEKAAEQLRRYGGRVLADTVDVSDEKQVVDGFARALEALGRVDCAIANAGVTDMATSSLDLETERWHALLSTNLHGSYFTLREAGRHMRERAAAGDPGGSLIACGSLSIWRGVPGMPHYVAAKGALMSICSTMASDLGRYGIRVNMIAPGYVKTGLGGDGPDPERDLRDGFFADKTPIQRPGTPADFEGIAAYLASDAASFHSGDVIVIDGGYMTRL